MVSVLPRTAVPSPFGQELRSFRKQRRWSQLELALKAETTPRHLSFLETGRSRPGRELVLRLAQALELSIRQKNALLLAAGLAPAFAEHSLFDEELRPFREAIQTILDRHDPYPASALSPLGQVLMTNAGCRAFSPGVDQLSPEEALDSFMGPGAGRESIDNWAEVAFLYTERLEREATHAGHPALLELAMRARNYLKGVERPHTLALPAGPIFCIRFKVAGEIIPCFSTVVRFEGPYEVTMSELRIELLFPSNQRGQRYFQELLASAQDASAL